MEKKSIRDLVMPRLQSDGKYLGKVIITGSSMGESNWVKEMITESKEDKMVTGKEYVKRWMHKRYATDVLPKMSRTSILLKKLVKRNKNK